MTHNEGQAHAEKEIEAIRETMGAESGTWGELLWPGVRMALVVGVALCFFQGWSGGAAVNFYAPLIVQKANAVGGSTAILETLLLNVSSLVFTTVSLFLLDIVGRRPMLLIGAAGMAISHVFLGWALYRGLPGIYTVTA